MRIVVLADDLLKAELLAQANDPGISTDSGIQWIHTLEDVGNHKGADAFIDLLFFNDQGRIDLLKELQSSTSHTGIFVNSVSLTTKELPAGFIRFNGWPGLLKK